MDSIKILFCFSFLFSLSTCITITHKTGQPFFRNRLFIQSTKKQYETNCKVSTVLYEFDYGPEVNCGSWNATLRFYHSYNGVLTSVCRYSTMLSERATTTKFGFFQKEGLKITLGMPSIRKEDGCYIREVTKNDQKIGVSKINVKGNSNDYAVTAYFYEDKIFLLGGAYRYTSFSSGIPLAIVPDSGFEFEKWVFSDYMYQQKRGLNNRRSRRNADAGGTLDNFYNPVLSENQLDIKFNTKGTKHFACCRYSNYLHEFFNNGKSCSDRTKEEPGWGSWPITAESIDLNVGDCDAEEYCAIQLISYWVALRSRCEAVLRDERYVEGQELILDAFESLQSAAAMRDEVLNDVAEEIDDLHDNDEILLKEIQRHDTVLNAQESDMLVLEGKLRDLGSNFYSSQKDNERRFSEIQRWGDVFQTEQRITNENFETRIAEIERYLGLTSLNNLTLHSRLQKLNLTIHTNIGNHGKRFDEGLRRLINHTTTLFNRTMEHNITLHNHRHDLLSRIAELIKKDQETSVIIGNFSSFINETKKSIANRGDTSDFHIADNPFYTGGGGHGSAGHVFNAFGIVGGVLGGSLFLIIICILIVRVCCMSS